jgi:hypothetical protein
MVDPTRATPSTARTLTAARVGFVLLVVSSFLTGYLGLWQLASHGAANGVSTSVWDLLYADLQLFVLQSPPVSPDVPLALQIARFAAPAVTVYALIAAGYALFADRLRARRAQRRRGHVIVTGDTPAARTLTQRLVQAGATVVAVPGDGSDPDVLRAAGVLGATKLYAVADDRLDSSVNITTALAALTLRQTSPGLDTHAHVPDATLALALRARRIGLSRGDANSIDFFSIDELAAHELARGDDFRWATSRDCGILVAGAETFGRTLIVEYARQWRLRRPDPAATLSVTLVDPQAKTVAHDLASLYPVVAAVCDLRPVVGGLTAVAGALVPGRTRRVFLCTADEQHNLQAALTLTDLWQAGDDSLVVRLDRLAQLGPSFGDGQHHLDGLSGRLRLVGVNDLGSRTVAVNEDLTQRIAHAIHDNYVAEQIAAGATFGQAAVVGWEDLADTYRAANIAQAKDIGVKLKKIGCTVAPATADQEPFEFTADEVEQLSIHEHVRWSEERRSQGWVYDAVRDDALKHHDCLVDWDVLPEARREQDRSAVRGIPHVLADVGLRIIRLAQ